MSDQHVFAYGSLLAGRAGRPAQLAGHRRVWGVAMDNRIDIPGYKSYRLRADGSRPPVFVAFLDIVADAQAHTGGILLAADGRELAQLGERERNYERVDVTAALAAAPGTIWTYRGTPAGRARLALGRRRGCAVVDRAYLEAVRAGLAACGLADDADPGDLPVLDLERIEVAPASASAGS